MEGKRFIKSVRPTNFLSFGPEFQGIELEPLNVLIGPNTAGKSNFIELFRFLHWTTRNDIAFLVGQGGGAKEYLFKGSRSHVPAKRADIRIVVGYPAFASGDLIHAISFGEMNLNLIIEKESIGHGAALKHGMEYYSFERNKPAVFRPSGAKEAPIPLPEIATDRSIISQIRDPQRYEQITYLDKLYENIQLYQNQVIGSDSIARKPQRVNSPSHFLFEDASNLALILNKIENHGEWDKVSKVLSNFYPDFEKITQYNFSGNITCNIFEKGRKNPITMQRISDGTMKLLIMLAILLNPEPPKIICIEEPEIGFHPDIIPTIAELLIEAAQRSQLIITTHSDTLVSALSEIPEAVIVCEREESGTTMRRLEKKKLKKWLTDYSLGDLWVKGEIGGNRW